MSQNNRSLISLACMGAGGSGKTATTVQYVANHFVEYYDPTIEDSYRKSVELDGVTRMVDILDTAGQEEFSALRDSWIRDCDGFLLIYSVTSKQSMQELAGLVEEIRRNKIDEEGEPIIHIIGNKIDLESNREVSKEEGAAFAKTLGVSTFSEISAKTRQGLTEAWESLVRETAGPIETKSNKKMRHRNAGCTIL